MGYSAGAIFDCLPQFQKLLDRTSKNNLLVRACKIYLESSFITASLKVLSNCTYYVTMPFLNLVECCDQTQLVELLPQLYSDLHDGKCESEALLAYRVPWTHVKINDHMLTSELELLMMKEMCITASASLKLQCSREYWDEEGDKRATAIHELSREVQKNLPTENLVTERYLAHFGALASQSAKHSNPFFKAKRIRDNLTLFTEEDPQYDNKKAYYKILDEMERSWTEKQKQTLK